jgi:predicted SnoaL-like aldol condensation-catalyzing enzyme
MLRTLCIAAFVAFAPAAHATTAEQMEANKKAVAEFYEFAVNKKDFEAAAKFLGPRYVQHNPNAADGPEGLKAYIAFLRDKFPDAHSDVIRVFADGDFVIQHVHSVPTPGSRGNAIVNIGMSSNRFRKNPLITIRCSSVPFVKPTAFCESFCRLRGVTLFV